MAYPEAHFKPSDWLRFVQSSLFTRRAAQLSLSDDDIRALEMVIMLDPKIHPAIRGTGGLRKLRFAKQESDRGKSRAYRVCYAYFEEYGIVFLATIFGKGEKENLSTVERQQIAALIRDIQDRLEKGTIR